jgi:hypothetical protein
VSWWLEENRKWQMSKWLCRHEHDVVHVLLILELDLLLLLLPLEGFGCFLATPVTIS